ncbi:peptidase associated/transthyretin-like domain-containing protein [Flavitalea antarctica]
MYCGKSTIRVIFGLLLSVVFSLQVTAQQVRVSGRVYDITGRNPLEAVTVLSTSGRGTITDSTGKYSIVMNDDDSIWFSYLNKPTPKYPVQSIGNRTNFEILLHVNVSDLRPVQVMPPSYKRDSMQNREDYAKAFNFRKPSFGTSINPSTGGVGLDINELINMFNFKKNRRMLAFQDRLLREEEERYIYHRFSRSLVIKLTNLRGQDLDTFMVKYKPSVEFVQFSTDYEFQAYIKTCHERFMRLKRMMGDFRKDT